MTRKLTDTEILDQISTLKRSLNDSDKTDTHEDQEPDIKEVTLLSGVWGMLFKVQLGLFPLCLAWCVWVTTTLYQLEPNTPRYSQHHADRDHLILMREVDERLAALPPPDWRNRIASLEDNQIKIRENQIRILEKLNSMGETQAKNRITDRAWEDNRVK